MKIKTLVCNCKGLDPFRYADTNTLAFEMESELDVTYTAMHPQLCARGGIEFLEDVLKSAEDDPDTYVMVCACDGDTQRKLFKKAMRDAEFDEQHLVPVDIRNATNDGILERIRERIVELTGKQPH